MGRSSRVVVIGIVMACRSSPSSGPSDTPTLSQPTDAFASSDSHSDAAATGSATITPGAPDRFLLTGTIIAPDRAFYGQVLVEQSTITCVDTSCAAMPGATGATLIDTRGIIAPGLIDTHNHILFDIFDNSDWFPAQLYQDHDQWTTEPKYEAMLDVKQCLVDDSQGKPAWCATTTYGSAAGSLRCEIDKYGELKGLVAGTTSIVGLPGTSAACFGSLARSIDVAQNQLATDKIQTSALYPPSDPSTVCANFASGKTDAYLIHVGEGDDAKASAELAAIGTMTTPANCLYAPQTAITHGVAFSQADFTMMASYGMKLVWSPQSNVSLYGATADIPTARAAGVTIALAPDWSMGGSQNLLDELRFAKSWSDANWSGTLAAQDLVAMTTANAAKVVALDTQLGALAPGYLADIAVYAGDTSAPYDAIVAARPNNVELVMVGGVALYGDAALVQAGPAQPGCEAIDICGTPKFLCVATTDASNKFDQTYAQITAAIARGLSDADAATPDDGFSFSPTTPLVTCN
jgi:5-methylthioadenosine/S-adenosylhomocysteine deaminase